MPRPRDHSASKVEIIISSQKGRRVKAYKSVAVLPFPAELVLRQVLRSEWSELQ